MYCYNAEAKKEWEKRARKTMNRLARELKARGFILSTVHFNPGGIAVWGEVSFHAKVFNRGKECSVYAMATKDTFHEIEQIMFRSEEWNNEPRHKRTGVNRYALLHEIKADAIAREAFAPLFY